MTKMKPIVPRRRKEPPRRVRLPLPAIGGGFHVASGHVLDAHGEVMGRVCRLRERHRVRGDDERFVRAGQSSARAEQRRARRKRYKRDVRDERDPPENEDAPDEETTSVAAGGLLAHLDASCHAEDALDLDGPAVSWGLDFKVADAAACCEACKASEKEKRMQLVGVLPR